MSYGQPPRQILQAEVREEQGLAVAEEERQERRGWWWMNHPHEDVISLLNYGFPFGLPEKTRGLILPNEVDMAHATLREILERGPKEGIGVCYENHVAFNPTSQLVSPEHTQASFYLFGENRGWYRVCPEAPIFHEAA